MECRHEFFDKVKLWVQKWWIVGSLWENKSWVDRWRVIEKDIGYFKKERILEKPIKYHIDIKR